MASKHLPWLDRHGRMLTDERLKVVSKDWDHSTWESFLDWQDVTLTESLVSPFIYDQMSEGLETSVFDSASAEREPVFSQNLNDLFRRLTKRQKQVIRLTFEECLTDREIASRLSISRRTVRDLKHRSMEKLKELALL